MTRSFLLALALLGCGEHAEPPLGARAQGVIGGKDSAATDDGVVAVVIQRTNGASVCSGSLVAANLVLTARHCVTATYAEDNIRCQADGTLDMPSGGVLGAPVEPTQVTIYVGADPSKDGISGLPGGNADGVGQLIVTTSWPNVCRDDVALVVLDREVSAPTLALDLTTKVTKATRISSVGYGLTEGSAQGDLWSTRKRRDGVAVKYIDALPNTFGVGRAVCQGDSGGPALDSVSGGIVGVYSLGFPGVDLSACSSENALNYYARIGAYEPLLRDAFAAAEQPFPEPTSGSGGAANGEAGAGSSPAVPSDGGAGGSPAVDEEPIEEPTSADDSGCSVTGSGAAGPSLSVAIAAIGALIVRSRRRRLIAP